MLEAACLDLGAIPVLAQLLERAALTLFNDRRAPQGQWIPTLIELHACGTRLDARLRERHVGIVAERQPVFATGMSITQRPRRAVASLFAQAEPIAIAEQHRLTRAMRPLDRECRQLCTRHEMPPCPSNGQLRIYLQFSYTPSYNSTLGGVGGPWTFLA